MSLLKLREDAGGERHYIDEKPIHCGDSIRAVINGKWQDGRYEASWVNGRIVNAFFIDEVDDIWRLTDRSIVGLP
jgi:hypothetical protein